MTKPEVCKNCRFMVEFRNIIMCRRYPDHIPTQLHSWCGEYTEKSE